MQAILKGGIQQKRDENEKWLVLASRKEVEYFLNCGNHSGKDNILFFAKDGFDKKHSMAGIKNKIEEIVIDSMSFAKE